MAGLFDYFSKNLLKSAAGGGTSTPAPAPEPDSSFDMAKEAQKTADELRARGQLAPLKKAPASAPAAAPIVPKKKKPIAATMSSNMMSDA